MTALLTALVLAQTPSATPVPSVSQAAPGPSSRVFAGSLGFSPQMDARGDWFVYRVLEALDGPAGTDLNGDGDAQDSLWALHDLRSGTTTLLDTPATQPALGDGFVVGRSYEGSVGTDANGDGDLTDPLLVTIDLATQAKTLRVAPAVDIDGAAGSLVAFRSFQQSNGNLHVYSTATDAVVQLPADGMEGLSPRGIAYGAREEYLGVDLNGDGDTQDTVASFLASDLTTTYSAPMSTGRPLWAGGRLAVFPSRESADGIDRTGDGDLDDLLVMALDTTDGQTALLGVGQLTSHGVGRRHTIFYRDERDGGDLNGDGDALDLVLVSYDHASGAYRSSRLTADELDTRFALSERGTPTALLLVHENGTDLNGNGSTDDAVPHYWDIAADAVWNTGGFVETFRNFVVGEGCAYWWVQELEIGYDVTGDGAAFFDPILARYQPGDSVQYLGAVPGQISTPTSGLRRGLFFFGDEGWSGSDLNGDGDQSDPILHWLSADGRRAIRSVTGAA